MTRNYHYLLTICLIVGIVLAGCNKADEGTIRPLRRMNTRIV